MAREIAKAYDPQQIEPRWAEFWVKDNLFRADANAPGPVFSIVIPPPNVTGSLHIGHMLNHTEIDILTRWHRMRGFNTLYLPGTDHAGISTQRVVVKKLADQGIDYRKLGREEFEKKVWERPLYFRWHLSSYDKRLIRTLAKAREVAYAWNGA